MLLTSSLPCAGAAPWLLGEGMPGGGDVMWARVMAQQLAAGNAQTAAVYGRRGMGKSHTLHGLSAALRREGVNVLRAYCHKEDEDRPFALIQQLVEHSAPASTEGRDLVEATCSRAKVGPLAILIDNLHRADRAPLQGMRHLPVRQDTLPIGLAVSVDPTTQACDLVGDLRTAAPFHE